MEIKTTVTKTISLEDWLNIYAPKMKAKSCIKKLKELKIKDPEIVYKNRRKNYIKSRVI
ncbi:TPA: hypothetical protein ACXDAZ_003518 [Clostridium botulinum]|uniref:hypothetical protein n=1 Tax=Clostridium botulinum TaxID=1491 RepID=UPI00090C9076|nr:hypothetical protein [Clostridium botulinum]APC80369.1 hypothetical protein NPD2_203 [Clostridium botulinum]MCS4446210.1 hypothetical protein [Clostridium botulinum]MCS4456594.1 hypothetical protein [Clostridium botulinum]MCS4461099.1 hypothetical protein [Clostridium botulinum]MCS4513290.1 hypothetical protein [Clostridium botulinum]